jgi:capsular polysaccharide biosynthesis protein
MNLRLCDYASWREGTARQIDTGIEPVVFRFTGQDTVTTLCQLTESEDASILGAEFIPVHADGRCTFEYMVHTPAQFPGKSQSVRTGDGRCESTATDWLRSDETLVLVGGCANYYHWLIDYLPRLMLVEGMAQYDDCPIVINEPLADHQRQALALLEVDPQRWLSLSPTQAITAPRVVVPTMMSNTTVCHPVVPRMLRQAFAPTGRQGPKRVYLSRDDANNRRLSNEAELVALLSGHGFVKVVAGELSFQQQIDLFAGAEVVVAVHGAGLTNMVFSAPGTQVIEVTLHDFRPTFMRLLAQVCKLRHLFVNASMLGHEGPPYRGNPLMADWCVDMADMQRALDKLPARAP